MPVALRWLLALGPLNPIAVRLVHNGSRRPRHFYVRAAYLAALIAVLLYALLLTAGGDELSYQQLAAAGSASFESIAYLQIGLICVLAPVFMAGAIAQEADPRTWDILLTTPLSATQIVLGNLLGRLFFILALLFSSLPLFAVTQYFGGVPGQSIFASYLIAAGAALLVGALAIALSVSRLVGRRAVFTFYVGVVSYLAITWAIDRVGAGGNSVSWMTAINPFLALQALLDPTGYPPARPGTVTGLAAWFLGKPVTTWVMLSCGLGVVLVAISAATVRAGGLGAWQGAGRSRAPKRRGGAPASSGAGAGAGVDDPAAGARAGRVVWHNPIAWREAAARNATPLRIAARWSFLGLGVLWALGLVYAFHAAALGIADFRSVMLTTVVAELAVITLVAVNMSSTAVSREREDGTLDLLLTTPVTPRQYLSGKLQGIIAYLAPMLAVPVGTLLLAGLYVLLADAGLIERAGGVSVAVTVTGNAAGLAPVPGVPGAAAVGTILVPAVLPEAGLIAALVLLPFLALCVLVGMWWSLKSRGTLTSVVGAVGVLLAAAGSLGLCTWQAGADLPALGPVIAGFSPASTLFALVDPENALRATVDRSGLTAARTGLLVGALIGTAVFGAIVYALLTSMVRTFDMTVRRLAGVK